MREARGQSNLSWHDTVEFFNSTQAELEAPKEVDQRGIDFLRSLLLGPVTAARKHECPPKMGHELRQPGNELVHTAEGDHQVLVPGDVERGDVNARPGKG